MTLMALADSDREILNMLNKFKVDTIVNILRKQISALPEDDQQYFEDEIKTWGDEENKHVLINDIIDILDTDEIMDELDEVVPIDEHAALGILGQEDDGSGNRRKDAPHRHWSPGQDFWSPEVEWERKTPFGPVPTSPDVKSEEGRIMPHPELDYKYDDLWDREWAPGTAPVWPENAPDFSEAAPADIAPARKDMELQIKNAISPQGQIGVPRPHIMEMVYRYLEANDPEAAKKYNIDDVSSRSVFGHAMRWILNRLFKSLSIEDLYLYWNSIVNHKVLPGVNPEYVDARYGGGKMGKPIDGLYESWATESSWDFEDPDWPVNVNWYRNTEAS